MAASFVTEWHDISLNCNSAALFHNASTKFSDGTCFGIGAEVLPVGCVFIMLLPQYIMPLYSMNRLLLDATVIYFGCSY